MGQSWGGYGWEEGGPQLSVCPLHGLCSGGVSSTLLRRGLQSAPGALPGLGGSQLCSCLGLAPALRL